MSTEMREFLRQEAVSTPPAVLVGALDAEAKEKLIQDLDLLPQPHLDDGGVVFPMRTWLVTAGRQGL